MVLFAGVILMVGNGNVEATEMYRQDACTTIGGYSASGRLASSGIGGLSTNI